MEENIRVNGLITIWRVWESIHGRMVVDMKESTKMIRSMDMEFTHGLI